MSPLFWKISLQIVVGVVLFVVVLLDYKWYDKRTKKFKRLRTGLFILLFLSLLSNVFQVFFESRDQERVKQQTVNRIAKHLDIESKFNFQAIQLKGGHSWGLVTQPPTDITDLRYELFILKIFKYYTQAPKIWSADLKLLAHFPPEGDRAYSSLLRVYDQLDKAEKDEAELIRLIEAEQRPEARYSLFKTLHEHYDHIRSVIEETAPHFQALLRRTERSKRNH